MPDALCGTCHADKAESFAEVGMGKSFYRPSANNVIEDFTLPPFFHEPSDRFYQISLRGESYHFKRWRRAADGAEVDTFERRIDWIMGSGHHSRVYLYQTANGALFQLPLAWYSQDGKWAMAPGFEFSDHFGVRRPVPQRCIGCHNGYAEMPVGSDRPGMPDQFPHDLPEGIGCQRCHGPGASHAAVALGGEAEPEQIRAEIVNPADLPNEQLYSICYGCHMQPSVAVNSGLSFGRTNFSFRPGQDVHDFIVQLDIVDAGRAQEDRFDINHHPYRLEQSACFTESSGALGCLTCHDPHVKRKPEERAAHYRAACLTCHETDTSGQIVAFSPGVVHPETTQSDDCTTCHMPARRTDDVIEVWMTDHKITRLAGENLLDPIAKIPPEVTEIFALNPDSVSRSEERLHALVAILNTTNYEADYAADALDKALKDEDPGAIKPWTTLARARMKQGDMLGAIVAINELLAIHPDHPQAKSLLASAYAGAGNLEKARETLDKLLVEYPDLTTSVHNLAAIYRRLDQPEQALRYAKQALAAENNHWPSLRLIAEIEAGRGNIETAIKAYLDALSIDPNGNRLREPLADLLTQVGREEEAKRHNP